MRRTALMFTAFALMVGLVATSSPLAASARGSKPRFDLQAHRGGIGLTVESTIVAFSKALEVGVSTLELDIQITEDGRAVVTHDRRVSGLKCRDTAPYVAGDPEFPYVGKYVNTLTFDQVRQLDCGSQTLSDFPGQVPDPGARMPELKEVFALVRSYHANRVKLNIETKVEAGAPSETAPRAQFVRVVAREIGKARIGRQVTIQSFDWGSLMLMKKVAPELPLIALTNYDFLQTGQPGRSPWLGGIDIDDFNGNLVRAVVSFGATAISPVHGFPQNGEVSDANYQPYVTRAMVRQAHRAGLKVIPWTVDDPDTMRSLIDKEVDGIITNYPVRLRSVLGEYGLKLPRSYQAPAVEPLAQAHAHNDYEHRRPLQDALDRGFASVEADVWLIDGELRVAHDIVAAKPGVTLESLYLGPLQDRVKTNEGSVYRTGKAEFQLLVDIKSDGPTTYLAIHRALKKYPRLFTTVRNGKVRERAVSVVISGNRPLELMQGQQVRYAGYDGHLTDLESDLPASLMPLVSDNWTKHFTWNGEGPFPAAERAELHRIVHTAHDAGYWVRFWATPDLPGAARHAIWTELAQAGVDHINTDDLHGLEIFLRSDE